MCRLTLLCALTETKAPVTITLRYSVYASSADTQTQLERQTGETRDFMHGEDGGTLIVVRIAVREPWLSHVSHITACIG